MDCNHVISDAEAKNSFSVQSKSISCEIHNAGCYSDDHKFIKLHLYINNDPLLEANDYSLYEYKSVNGKKIAKIQGIKLQKQYRGLGIVRHILQRNSAVLKKNDFSCIELVAIRDGVLAWPRLGFTISKQQHRKVLLTYARKYLFEIRNIQPVDLKYTSIDQIDNDLLKSNEENPEGFTEWYCKQTNEHIEMKKEL